MDGEWKCVAVALLCTVSVSVFLLKWREQKKVYRKVQRAREKRKKEIRQAETAIRSFKAQNPAADLSSIVTLPLPELRQRIRGGSLQPDAVVCAYMEKALEVNRKLNCIAAVLTESFKHLDDIESHKDGLLYGVPISIKDNLDYEGYDSTCGLLTKLENPASKDCVVVSVLKKQGAIPFIKTNIPQSLISFECSNPIYGRTANPCNPKKIPGGSSGGEGALIASGGSILGLGTDLGGSVRVPAALCGICGLKPTRNRIRLSTTFLECACGEFVFIQIQEPSNTDFGMLGLTSSMKGIKAVQSTIGPMARDVESLAMCMRALLCTDMFDLDATVPPISFNQEVYESSEPLRIGYYENNGYSQPSPSMSRALRETKELLEKAGHTLIPFTHPRIVTAYNELCVKGLQADGGTTILKQLKEGPIDPCLREQVKLWRLPKFIKKMMSLLCRFTYPHLAAMIQASCGVDSSADLWKQQNEAEDYIHETIDEWRKLELDVLLCPMLGPAYDFNRTANLLGCASYAILYNMLNFPVGVVPVTEVTAVDVDQLKDHKESSGNIWAEAVRGGVGLPVAVQCVALPWQEEMCLRFMREVEELCAKNNRSNTHH